MYVDPLIARECSAVMAELQYSDNVPSAPVDSRAKQTTTLLYSAPYPPIDKSYCYYAILSYDAGCSHLSYVLAMI